jgi:hypothetical protein
MKARMSLFYLLLICNTALISCGGAAHNPTNHSTATVNLVSAVTDSLSPGIIITGYDISVTLPNGTSVKSTNPPDVDAGIVTLSDLIAGSSLASFYTPAQGITPAKIRILLVNGGGVNPGSLCTVKCDIVSGPLQSKDFSISLFSATGFDTVTDSTVDLTPQISITAAAVN